MAGKVELASGVGAKASKATTCVQDCRSKSALPSHYTSVKLFGNVYLTCLTHMSVVRI